MLLSQPPPLDETSRIQSEFIGVVDEAAIEQSGPIRAVILIQGRNHDISRNVIPHKIGPWLPILLRFYLYAYSTSIRMMHTLIFNISPESDFIRGIGITFDIPLASDPLFDRQCAFQASMAAFWLKLFQVSQDCAEIQVRMFEMPKSTAETLC